MNNVLDDHSTLVTRMPHIPAGARWFGPDTTKNVREMKERYAAAAAATPPCPPPPPDPLTAANLRIAELEGKLHDVQWELELERARNGNPVHQRSVEKRKA